MDRGLGRRRSCRDTVDRSQGDHAVPSGHVRLLGLAAALVLLGVCPPAVTAAPTAVPSPAAIPGTRQLTLTGAVDLGPVAPGTLDVTIVLPLRDRGGAEALAVAVHRPGDPAYLRFLAAGEFASRFGADPGKPLGDHPSLGGVAVKNGRYGAYVTSGGVNATIPSDKTPETITLAEAIALILEDRRQDALLAIGSR